MEKTAQFKMGGRCDMFVFLNWYAKPCTQGNNEDFLVELEGNVPSHVDICSTRTEA